MSDLKPAAPNNLLSQEVDAILKAIEMNFNSIEVIKTTMQFKGDLEGMFRRVIEKNIVERPQSLFYYKFVLGIVPNNSVYKFNNEFIKYICNRWGINLGHTYSAMAFYTIFKPLPIESIRELSLPAYLLNFLERGILNGLKTIATVMILFLSSFSIDLVARITMINRKFWTSPEIQKASLIKLYSDKARLATLYQGSIRGALSTVINYKIELQEIVKTLKRVNDGLVISARFLFELDYYNLKK